MADLEFVFLDIDARNEMEDAQIQEILVRSGIMTTNEIRALRGLPPLGASSQPSAVSNKP